MLWPVVGRERQALARGRRKTGRVAAAVSFTAAWEGREGRPAPGQREVVTVSRRMHVPLRGTEISLDRLHIISNPHR